MQGSFDCVDDSQSESSDSAQDDQAEQNRLGWGTRRCLIGHTPIIARDEVVDIILRTGGNMVDFDLAPSRTALLNVDMQNCFVENSPIAAPDGLTILARVNRLAAACREAGVLVIHTSIVLRPDGSNIGIFGEFSPPAKGGILNKGTQSAALHPGLVRGERDILLDKPRFGAFHGTDLELILRSRGIDSVIISGVATNICCETTAREAAVRDFHVFFLSDGTATAAMGNASAEELQKATCATLGFLFAQVLTVEEMIAKIERAA